MRNFKAIVKYNGNHLFSGDVIYGFNIFFENGNAFLETAEFDCFENLIRKFTVEVETDSIEYLTKESLL